MHFRRKSDSFTSALNCIFYLFSSAPVYLLVTPVIYPHLSSSHQDLFQPFQLDSQPSPPCYSTLTLTFNRFLSSSHHPSSYSCYPRHPYLISSPHLHPTAVSVSVSVWTLVAISLERFYAICQPLRSRRWQTASHAYRVIAGVWAASLLLMTPIAALSTLMPVRGDPGELARGEPTSMHI